MKRRWRLWSITIALYILAICCNASGLGSGSIYIQITDVGPDNCLKGFSIKMHSSQSFQEYRILLYIQKNGQWARYPDKSHHSQRTWRIDDEGQWDIDLKEHPLPSSTFAVLVVDASDVQSAPEFAKSFANIEHVDSDVFAQVQNDGSRAVVTNRSGNQVTVGRIFKSFDWMIVGLREELKKRDQAHVQSHANALVLIVNNVIDPGVYEIPKVFTFSSALHAAGGYAKQGSYSGEIPYCVYIIRHIDSVATVEKFLYRERSKWEDFLLKDGDILYFPVMM